VVGWLAGAVGRTEALDCDDEDGIPVARLMPYYRRAGLHADEIRMTETQSSALHESSRSAGLHERAIQTTPDFDEPLSDSFWVDDA